MTINEIYYSNFIPGFYYQPNNFMNADLSPNFFHLVGGDSGNFYLLYNDCMP